MNDIQTKYRNLRVGYAGERRVDREWQEVKISSTLLHDFTCFNELGHTHQIDTIFICKHFVLVVEIKNIYGRIDFDNQRSQFIRTSADGQIEGFSNPVDQVLHQRELLEQHALSCPEYVSIEAAVIITNSSIVIGRVSNEVPIFNVSGLLTKI